MKKNLFIHQFLPLARQAGESYRLNPVVILAQSAIETGWGESVLAKTYHNYFGITAYGLPNDHWEGHSVMLGRNSLSFRSYPSPTESFLDYARLIREAYPQAAEMSNYPEAFAKEIAYSRYISEVNGDNREAYRKILCKLCKQIEEMSAEMSLSD